MRSVNQALPTRDLFFKEQGKELEANTILITIFGKLPRNNTVKIQ
jgi:hypothetical protein